MARRARLVLLCSRSSTARECVHGNPARFGMPTCCASGCKSRYSRGKKLFSLPRGKDNAARQEVWLQRIGRTDLDPVSSRLCEVSTGELNSIVSLVFVFTVLRYCQARASHKESNRVDGKRACQLKRVPRLVPCKRCVSGLIHADRGGCIFD